VDNPLGGLDTTQVGDRMGGFKQGNPINFANIFRIAIFDDD
jgi:hypothetical protein